METIKYTINRNDLLLSFDLFEENENKIICFYNFDVNSNYLGEILKDKKGFPIIFDSKDNAKRNIVMLFKNQLYPPDFLKPVEYTIKNVSKVLNKKLEIEIGNVLTNEVVFKLKGIIIDYECAGNKPYLLTSITIKL